ncbi:hypothetical protein DFH27DRAFT_339201 [Peziza echinospora]|nr:hypothetical protein DFH27DRAFT_339201 [Peziza echinospora]
MAMGTRSRTKPPAEAPPVETPEVVRAIRDKINRTLTAHGAAQGNAAPNWRKLKLKAAGSGVGFGQGGTLTNQPTPSLLVCTSDFENPCYIFCNFVILPFLFSVLPLATLHFLLLIFDFIYIYSPARSTGYRPPPFPISLFFSRSIIPVLHDSRLRVEAQSGACCMRPSPPPVM